MLQFLERLQPGIRRRLFSRKREIKFAPSFSFPQNLHSRHLLSPKKIKHQQKSFFSSPERKPFLPQINFPFFFLPSLFLCICRAGTCVSFFSSPPPPNYNRLCARKNTHTFFEGGENVGWLADGGGKLGAIMWGERGVRTLLLLSFPRIWMAVNSRENSPSLRGEMEEAFSNDA